MRINEIFALIGDDRDDREDLLAAVRQVLGQRRKLGINNDVTSFYDARHDLDIAPAVIDAIFSLPDVRKELEDNGYDFSTSEEDDSAYELVERVDGLALQINRVKWIMLFLHLGVAVNTGIVFYLFYTSFYKNSPRGRVETVSGFANSVSGFANSVSGFANSVSGFANSISKITSGFMSEILSRGRNKDDL